MNFSELPVKHTRSQSSHVAGPAKRSSRQGLIYQSLLVSENQFGRALATLMSDLITPIRQKVNKRHFQSVEGW